MQDQQTTDEAAGRAWQKVQTMATKLFEACEELDEAGGLREALAGWTPKSEARALATLRAARAALDAQVRELERQAGRRQGDTLYQ